ncbi:hypothetical protein Pla22_33800 [Rubripirellula amarantea]|uniref:Uncharacterized protein n=1 Tax=Rubripirellula amarantea TaxID=2527999 RepID=A0A5C5WJA7_9BACT|nr:hypothetical protein Pla22_33800 [Rubripirellula amarantea]
MSPKTLHHEAIVSLDLRLITAARAGLGCPRYAYQLASQPLPFEIYR